MYDELTDHKGKDLEEYLKKNGFNVTRIPDKTYKSLGYIYARKS